MFTRSFASTFPNRLVMCRSSSITGKRPTADCEAPSLRHRVRNLDLPGDDPLLRLFGGLKHLGRQQILVVLIDRVADAVFVQTIYMEAGLEPAMDDIVHDGVHGIVHALD